MFHRFNKTCYRSSNGSIKNKLIFGQGDYLIDLFKINTYVCTLSMKTLNHKKEMKFSLFLFSEFESGILYHVLSGTKRLIKNFLTKIFYIFLNYLCFSDLLNCQIKQNQQIGNPIHEN